MIYAVTMFALVVAVLIFGAGVWVGQSDAEWLLQEDLEERDYYKALWEGYQKEVALRKQRENERERV